MKDLNNLTTTVLSDISATFFAIFLIFFVVILAFPLSHLRTGPVTAPKSLDFVSDLDGEERVPHSPQKMLERLYARAQIKYHPEWRFLTLDLFEKRVVLSAPNGQTWIFAPQNQTQLQKELGEVFSQFPTSFSLLFFVHSASFYFSSKETTLQEKRAFDELSIPEALRFEEEGEGSKAWSLGFQKLMEAPLSFDVFRERLALLLAGGQKAQKEGLAAFKFRESWQSGSFSPGFYWISKIFSFLKALIMWGGLVLAFGIVWRLEIKKPKKPY